MADELTGEFTLHTTTPTTQPQPTSMPLTTGEEHTHPHKFPPHLKKNSLGIFTSVCVDPHNVSIINQDEDESIHLLVRRHWITNVIWMASVLCLAILPLFTPIILSFFPSFIEFSPSTIVSALSLYYLSLFGYTLLKFAEWYFHVGLITDKRLVDIDMPNILARNVAETEIQSVEDVTYIQKGLLQSIFHYGDVLVQTEAVMANFEFDRVPYPSEVAEVVSQLARALKKGGE